MLQIIDDSCSYWEAPVSVEVSVDSQRFSLFQLLLSCKLHERYAPRVLFQFFLLSTVTASLPPWSNSLKEKQLRDKTCAATFASVFGVRS